MMNTPHEQPTPAFARAVAEACRRLSGFEATQTVEAGPIRITARIRFHRPGKLAVEHSSFVNPLVDLEERLTGDVEYTADEIVGLSLHFDGERTWVNDAASGVCVVKRSRSLFEPLPEIALFGEIGYLRDLPHDYLVRELESETVDGRDARVLSLKPKHLHRTHAFKTVAFLARRATVAFDAETLFPLRLTFSPAAAFSARQLVGPNGTVTVRYAGVRLNSDELPLFSPPEGMRVFQEEWLDVEDLCARLPFRLPLDSFRESGYEAIDQRGLLAEDAEHDRAYSVVTFIPRGQDDQGRARYVTLRAGNYLSRNMARRRLTAAETGEEATIADHAARFLDRRPLWEEHASDIDSSPAPCELSWERDGIFWFLTAVNGDRSELSRLAADLIAGGETQP